MARATLQYDVDLTRASKKVYRLEKRLKEEAALSVKELGELGKFYARSIAPYYSGKTFRNIILQRGKEGTQAVIMAKNPTANDGHVRRIANFNLVRWMHQSPRAMRHIQSGDPHFMYRTRDYLRKQVPTRVTARFNKIVAEINT